jgi:hypothetical protein
LGGCGEHKFAGVPSSRMVRCAGSNTDPQPCLIPLIRHDRKRVDLDAFLK